MWLPCGFYYAATGSHCDCDSQRAWWTGKDSNLRSPQGAADLQSAGFSHSPTRPSLGTSGVTHYALKPGGTHFMSQILKIILLWQLHRNQRKHKTDSCLETPARLILTSKICRLFRAEPNQRWSWRRELNPRPSDYKSDALPAELRQPRLNRVRIADRLITLQG
jgi:hypothetical protein